MTQYEAMKLALEALEPVSTFGRVGSRDVDTVKAQEAITALQKALAEKSAPVQQGSIDDDWMPCMKLPVIVHVRQQRKGEMHVSTREGITPVKPDDLIMRGVSGEEYPIGRAIFEQTYSFDTSPQPAQQEIDWKDQYEKQKRRADMWVAKYEADIGPLEKAGPVTAQQDIWILTSEVNDYNQYGEYFVAVFIGKPTAEQIHKVCGIDEECGKEEVKHILSGGGRFKWCDRWVDQWYNLNKEEAANNIKEKNT